MWIALSRTAAWESKSCPRRSHRVERNVLEASGTTGGLRIVIEPEQSAGQWSSMCRPYNRGMEPSTGLTIAELVWQDPDRMSGAPCILGTRIRVQDLFDWVAGGGSVDGFVATYSHIPREMVVGILRLAESDLLRHIQAA
jgi:uncharacterized protein (DUF433 family)